jgi:hypothetical protein
MDSVLPAKAAAGWLFVIDFSHDLAGAVSSFEGR